MSDTATLPADLQELFDRDQPLADAIAARFAPDEPGTPPGASTDSTEDAGNASAPDAGATSEGAAGDETTTATATAGTTATLAVALPDGSTFDLDQDSAQRLLALASWAKSTEAHAQDFAAIESGQGRVIPNAEFEQFQAWQRSRHATADSRVQATDDALASLRDIDPDAAANIEALRAENARLAEQTRQPSQPSQEQVAFTTQQLQAREATFSTAVEQWASDRGIDNDKAGELLSQVVHSRVLERIVTANQQYSPTGKLLVDADLSKVAEIAMNFALANDPALFNEVAARTAQSATSEAAASQAAADAAIALKKARGASLASTPSASVAFPSKDPRTMTPAELTTAMADAIRNA